MSGPDMSPDEGTNGEAGTMHAFELLRSADPVGHDEVPAADGPHGRALLEEIVMSTPTTPDAGRVRRPILVAAGVGVAAVALVVGGLALGGDDTPDPAPIAVGSDEPTTDGTPISPGGGMAMCVATYDLTTLADREFAFDGTLTAVDGDEVTFEVTEVFAGDVGDEAVLGGGSIIVGEAGSISIDGAGLQVGDRALVAGDGGFAWGCGFTQPYDAAVADQWRDALS